MTIAERYNAEAHRLLPHMAADLAVDASITTANEIDDIVFRRSELARRDGDRHSCHD